MNLVSNRRYTMTFSHYTLRLLQRDDIESLHKLIARNRKRITDYFPATLQSTQELASTTLFAHTKIKQGERKDSFFFVIQDNVHRQLCGVLFIKNIDWVIPKAELAYFIDNDYQGKGIMTQAIGQLVALCFGDLKMNKLSLRIDPDNIASKKVAEKNGFKIEGLLRQDFKMDNGELIDVLCYGLLKEDLSY